MKAGNFVFVPDPGYRSGRLYELGSAGRTYLANSFVMIPYAEPRLTKPEPRFYAITGSSQISAFPGERESPPLKMDAGVSKSRYLEILRELKEHIQKGNIYEINFCIPFSTVAGIDPYGLFLRLCASSAAPYLMMARLEEDFVLCASPELFLKKEGGTLVTKPIKGTIARGSTAAGDVALREALFSSLKDRTENVMAVDVARNDLSILAQKGSVKVNRLYNIETFATVHQMVSTVSCDLLPGVTFHDIISATFPMASMTGAPKEKAMELITCHENFDRSFYSGSMGIIEENGDFTLPVLIRSIFYNTQSKRLWFATGGAVTHLSDPEEEYRECLLKAGTMLRALNAVLAV